MSVVYDWNIIFFLFSCCIFSGGNFCYKVVKVMIMEEFLRLVYYKSFKFILGKIINKEFIFYVCFYIFILDSLFVLVY